MSFTNVVNRYDLVFGIGQACGCSHSLRRAGLQHLSFPGDWTAPIWGDKDHPGFEHDVRNRANTLCDIPADFFRAEDFVCQRTISNTGRQVYVNRKTRYVFNHDFAIGEDFTTELPKVAARYRRRMQKLQTLIAASRRVLVVRIDIPEGKHPTSLDDCRYVREKLNARFAPARFDCLLMTNDASRPFTQRTFSEVEPGLFQISFDFLDRKHPLPNQPDLALTSAALREHFAVRDYRTDAERRQFAEKERCAKMEKRRLRRLKNLNRLIGLWYGRFNPLADFIIRRRRRRFEQFVILGFNCEPAFRFFTRWGFVDSSLFAWANCGDLMMLSSALMKFSRLGTEGFDYHPASRMWKCRASGVYFHGKMKAHPGDPEPTEAQLTADRDDLAARIRHLKEKFLAYVRNEKSTVFVYRLGKEAAEPALDNKIKLLERALANLGAKNAELLFVCERNVLHLMPEGANRTFRAVKRFNPTDDVTNRKKGDPAGWRRIYDEFAPSRILPKAHAFKFESE